MLVNWSKIKYFKPYEFNAPYKIQHEILEGLDAFRHFLGVKIIPTSDYRLGDKGEHGKGCAIDIIIPEFHNNIIDIYLKAERFNFQGIGVYSYWKYNGKRVGGLHLDKGGRKNPARWVCIEKDKYIAMNYKNLKLLLL